MLKSGVRRPRSDIWSADFCKDDERSAECLVRWDMLKTTGLRKRGESDRDSGVCLGVCISLRSGEINTG